MNEAKLLCMQCMAWTNSKAIIYKLFVFGKYSSFYNSVAAIKIIIKYRVADKLHVHTYLVCTACFKPALNKRYIIKSFQNFIMGYGIFSMSLSERFEATNDRIRTYQAMESTLQNTMVAATRSAEEIQAKAREGAEMTLRDAEIKAKEIIHNALQQRQRVANELIRIKQAEEEFRARYQSLLENQMRSVERDHAARRRQRPPRRD